MELRRTAFRNCPKRTREVLQPRVQSACRKETSDLRRCARPGAQRVMGPRANFLRVARGERHDKSPAGLRGTPNHRGLLCSLTAKVELARGRLSNVTAIVTEKIFQDFS